jgi:hypothetical protein
MAENVMAESMDDNADNTSSFSVKVEFAREANLFAALAKAYFAMFGLTDEKIIRQFTLFANQYRAPNEAAANDLESETKNFRGQDDLITAFSRTTDRNGYLIKKWTITIKVKDWFLERLKQFGIDFTHDNLNGKVNLKGVNPIPMIDKSDMQKGDIVLVGGTHSLSKTIRTATSSNYSHAAIYDGGWVYEALGGGMVSNRLTDATIDSNPVAVLRVITFNTAAAYKAVEYAKSIANQNTPYDVPGALASGVSWKMAVVIVPVVLLPFKVGAKINDAIFGNELSFFCSEAVAEAYESAGTPIIAKKPQDTTPGAIYHSPNVTLVGFLVNKV